MATVTEVSGWLGDGGDGGGYGDAKTNTLMVFQMSGDGWAGWRIVVAAALEAGMSKEIRTQHSPLIRLHSSPPFPPHHPANMQQRRNAGMHVHEHKSAIACVLAVLTTCTRMHLTTTCQLWPFTAHITFHERYAVTEK